MVFENYVELNILTYSQNYLPTTLIFSILQHNIHIDVLCVIIFVQL
jgi:hypothetical protein